jgi:hypothetical protein
MKFGAQVMNAIQGHLIAIIFNPVFSTVLKWLRFKVVQPCTAVVWDCYNCWVIMVSHIQSLSNVTMATIAIGKVGKLVPPELVLRSRMILCAF